MASYILNCCCLQWDCRIYLFKVWGSFPLECISKLLQGCYTWSISLCHFLNPWFKSLRCLEILIKKKESENKYKLCKHKEETKVILSLHQIYWQDVSGHVLPCILNVAVVEKQTPVWSCEGLLSFDQAESQNSKPYSGFLFPSCLSDLQSNNIHMPHQQQSLSPKDVISKKCPLFKN